MATKQISSTNEENAKTSPSKGCKINSTLLPVKIYYLLHEGGGAISPFVTLVAKKIGLSLSAVGLVNTITVVAALVAKPVVGGLIDKFGHPKVVWLTCHLLTVACVFSLIFIPSITTMSSGNCAVNATWHCTQEGSHFHVCQNQMVDLSADLIEYNAQCWSSLNAHWLSSLCRSDSDCQWQLSQQKTFTTNLTFLVDLRNSQQLSASCISVSVFESSSNFLPATCPTSTTMYCALDCDLTSSSLTLIPISLTYQFWWLASAVIVSGVCKRLVDVIQTSVVYTLIDDHHSLFGKQKIFGSLGYALACIGGGVLGEIYGDHDEGFEYRYNFYIYGVTMTLCSFVISWFHVQQQEQHSENIIQDVGFIFLRFNNCLVFVSVFFIGTFLSFQSTFSFAYLVDLGATPLMLGLAKGSQCLISEIPCLFISGWLIKRIGHNKVLCIIFLIHSMNFMIYAMMENAWFVFVAETLNGIASGLFLPAATSYFTLVAPSGTITTIHGIFFAIFKGVGRMAGNMGGGLLLDWYGGRLTYFALSATAFVCLIVHLILHLVLHRFEAGKLDITPNKK